MAISSPNIFGQGQYFIGHAVSKIPILLKHSPKARVFMGSLKETLTDAASTRVWIWMKVSAKTIIGVRTDA